MFIERYEDFDFVANGLDVRGDGTDSYGNQGAGFFFGEYDQSYLFRHMESELTGSVTGFDVQTHIYMGQGDDFIEMRFDSEINTYTHGTHIRGDITSASRYDHLTDEEYLNPNFSFAFQYDPENYALGADTYRFTGLDQIRSGGVVIGRIEDFDFSRDRIFLEGETEALDWTQIGSYTSGAYANVELIRYNGVFDDYSHDPQLWLKITTDHGGTIYYALEGARVDIDGTGGSRFRDADNDGTVEGYQEAHFILEETLAGATYETTSFVDPVNFVPSWYVETFPNNTTYNDLDADERDVGLSAKIYRNNEAEGIAGGLNDDWIDAKWGNDHVWGGSGNDVIYGGGGKDYIEGNSGNDTVYGGSGNDQIFGGIGDDTLRGWGNNDLIWGEAGNDNIGGNNGNDFLHGGEGNDILYGGNGNDEICGGTGDDFLQGDNGTDVLTGGDGFDIFSFATSVIYTDTILDFEIGKDTLKFDGDTITWGVSDVLLTGGIDGEPLVITVGSQSVRLESITLEMWEPLVAGLTIQGSSGSNILNGDIGDDFIQGRAGDDSVFGGEGHDELWGNSGNDMVDGGDGDDVLFGNPGNDILIGGAGDDVLHGRQDRDILIGGTGADTFVFMEADVVETAWDNAANIDMILDLDLTEDRIQLDFDDASQSTSTYFGVWGNQTMEHSGFEYEGVLMRLKGADGIADDQFIFIAGNYSKQDLVDIVDII